MSNLPSVIELGPADEAERLWVGSLEAREAADDDFPALCEALELGLRAVEILAIHRLMEVRDRFPATIQAQLETPAPDVDLVRDAVHAPNCLDFVAVLDLLSEGDLECVSPGMHRGWEDRRFACRRSRETAREAVGVTLEGDQREQLLVLAAYRNRVFRSPPPLRLVPLEILGAFGSLDRFKESLG
ncbi:MAG: hypothetical protein P8170_07810 [Gemmatimonadota bacterium]|jgi:hypothetical protein